MSEGVEGGKVGGEETKGGTLGLTTWVKKHKARDEVGVKVSAA